MTYMATAEVTKGMRAEDLFNLKDSMAVVTGGTRGLGRQIAECLAANGANLTIGARDEEALKATKNELEGRYNVKVIALRADVTEPTQVKQLIKAAYDYKGRLDALVNNAGVSGTSMMADLNNNHGRKLKTEDEVKYLQNILYTNYYSVALPTSEAVEYMKRRGYGRIVNIASAFGQIDENDSMKEYLSGLVGLNNNIPVELFATRLQMYRHSKKTQIVQTLHDANRYGQFGITVNAIAPTYVDLEKDLSKSKSLVGYWKGLQMIEGALAPINIMPALLYLMSPYSSYTTGHTITVDGGWHPKTVIKNKKLGDPKKHIDHLATMVRVLGSKWSPFKSSLDTIH